MLLHSLSSPDNLKFFWSLAFYKIETSVHLFWQSQNSTSKVDASKRGGGGCVMIAAMMALKGGTVWTEMKCHLQSGWRNR